MVEDHLSHKMKKILIVNSNYYKKISENLVLNAKKKLLNIKYEKNYYTFFNASD